MTTRSLKCAALFAGLSAVTTLLLWLLPRLYPAPGGVDEAVALHANPFYMARLWVNFVHIFFALVAYGASAWLLSRRSLALAWGGMLSFVLWGFTELLGVTVNLFAVNGTWRAGYATATPELQQQLRANIAAFGTVWDAMFFLLLVAFLIGTACYGLAAIRGAGIERLVGWLFLLAVPLTVAIMLGGYTRLTALNVLVDWTYPVLQPVSRVVLAGWLWRSATTAGRLLVRPE